MRQKHIQYTYGASFTQLDLLPLHSVKSVCLSRVQSAGKLARKAYYQYDDQANRDPQRCNLPSKRFLLPARFFMGSVYAAPIAKLVQFDLPGDGLLVLPGVVIDVFAGRATQPGQLFFKL